MNSSNEIPTNAMVKKYGLFPVAPAPPVAVGVANRSKRLVGRDTDVIVKTEPIKPIAPAKRKYNYKSKPTFSWNRQRKKEPWFDNSELLDRRWTNALDAATSNRASCQWLDKNEEDVRKLVKQASNNTLKRCSFVDERGCGIDTFKIAEETGLSSRGDDANSIETPCGNIGYLGGSRTYDKPRPRGLKDWWIHDDKLLKDFILRATELGWNKRKMAYVIEEFYMRGKSDEELCDGYFSGSECAAKSYRNRMVKLGFGWYGLNPEAPPEPTGKETVIERKEMVLAPVSTPNPTSVRGVWEEHTIYSFPGLWRTASWLQWARDGKPTENQKKPPEPGQKPIEDPEDQSGK